VPGLLHLRHALGWERWVALDAGTVTLWEVPTGDYVASFSPAAPPPNGNASSAAEPPLNGNASSAAEPPLNESASPESATPIEGLLYVWGGMTTEVGIHPAEGVIRQSDRPDDGLGAALLVTGALLQALPAEKETALAALDTHTRWRPGSRLAGQEITIPTERREIVPGTRATLGPSWISISPGAPAVTSNGWNLTLGPSLPIGPPGERLLRPSEKWLQLQGAASSNSHDGTEFSATLGIARLPFGGLDLCGLAEVSYQDLGDASPRSGGRGSLPHNDAKLLDLTGHLEIGAPDAGTIGKVASQRNRVQGPGRLGDAPWGVRLQIASRGWQRNHFLEIYRRNLDHAPYEETALFLARGTMTLSLGELTRSELSLGYGRYLTRLTDGLYKGNLERYGGDITNGGADESGLYWSGKESDGLEGTHVFDYYQRKFTQTLRGGLAVTHAPRGADLLLRGSCEASLHTYRRYEHFSPTDTWAPDGGYAKALNIGYDETGEHRSDDPIGPGEPLTVRAGLSIKMRPREQWRLDAGVSGMFFSSRDSSLVSLTDPLGENGILDPDELEQAGSHLSPEGHLSLRWKGAHGTDLWGRGYRQAYLPPLEAVYSPRAHLRQSSTEGVMGNPSLAPEVETGGEIGLSLPVALAGQSWRLTAAAYVARLDEAISMAYAHVASEGAPGDTLLATYENAGTLRRWGLHLEAVFGDARGPLWARLSYDLARIESDHCEPSLLDGRWLYPDRPQGEYESEGYGGPLGGILDEVTGGGISTLAPGSFRPANSDRAHCLSLAVVARGTPSPRHSDWFDTLTRGWTLGAIGRFETGRPYTQTYLYAAGVPPDPGAELRGEGDAAWEDIVGEQERNALRMPNRLSIDLALTRRLPVGARHLTISLEALNLLDIQNAGAVYRATGKPDDDGCLGAADCEGSGELPEGATAALYKERVRDPRHFDRPLILRIALTLELI
jgi:hypothetical protein